MYYDNIIWLVFQGGWGTYTRFEFPQVVIQKKSTLILFLIIIRIIRTVVVGIGVLSCGGCVTLCSLVILPTIIITAVISRIIFSILVITTSATWRRPIGDSAQKLKKFVNSIAAISNLKFIRMVGFCHCNTGSRGTCNWKQKMTKNREITGWLISATGAFFWTGNGNRFC